MNTNTDITIIIGENGFDSSNYEAMAPEGSTVEVTFCLSPERTWAKVAYWAESDKSEDNASTFILNPNYTEKVTVFLANDTYTISLPLDKSENASGTTAGSIEVSGTNAP